MPSIIDVKKTPTWGESRFPARLLGSVSPEEYERAVEVPWIFRTQYENSYGKRLIDKHIVDFAQFRGVFFESNYMEQMAEHTKGIRNDLHRLTEGYARIQIVTQTREEHERRREEWRKAQENRISDITEMPIADGDEQWSE